MNNLSDRILCRKEKSLHRVRHVLSKIDNVNAMVDKKAVRVFCSNDYLGLSQHPQLISALKEGVDRFGVSGTSSQLVAGHLTVHRQAEEAFADFLGCPAAILFSNGFMANQGVITTLAQKNDLIFADKLVHASIIDACKLTHAKLIRYPHLNYESLVNRLQQHASSSKLIVTDSVFSMRGDIVNLPVLTKFANQFNAALIVDDAHGIGILGKSGGGICEYFKLSREELPVLVCPLAKAFGIMGAVVAGPVSLIEGIIQFARSYIYSNAIPGAFAYAALRALEIVKQEKWRRDQLNENINYFRTLAGKLDLNIFPSRTPIQVIHIGDASKALQISQELLIHGFLLNSMRAPTVPAGFANLRITLSCYHKKNDINELLNRLCEIHNALS